MNTDKNKSSVSISKLRVTGPVSIVTAYAWTDDNPEVIAIRTARPKAKKPSAPIRAIRG